MKNFFVAFGPMMLKIFGVITILVSLLFINNLPVTASVFLFGAWILFIGLFGFTDDKYCKISYLISKRNYMGVSTMVFLKSMALVGFPVAGVYLLWPCNVVKIALCISIGITLLAFAVFMVMAIIDIVKTMYNDAIKKLNR